jgi:hypothetical protein
MFAKKVLATIFAVLILFKLVALLLVNPNKWLNFSGLLLAHHVILTYVYLALIVITGYYIFSSLNLIDIALVMFFTSMLTGLSLIPYSTPLFKFGEAMATIGLSKAWLAMAIWGALAVAVLARVFSKLR